MSTGASGGYVLNAPSNSHDMQNREAHSHAQLTEYDDTVDEDQVSSPSRPGTPTGGDVPDEENPSIEESGNPGSDENIAGGEDSSESNGGESGGSNDNGSGNPVGLPSTGKNGSTNWAGGMSEGGGASRSQGNASSGKEFFHSKATEIYGLSQYECCHDKLNPKTGISDCPALRHLCNHTLYYALMTDQCPKTCGRCKDGTVATGEECVDRVNPKTGKTECPALRYLCNHPIYHPLMRDQCPRTCNTCTTQVFAAECRDLANPLTGVSECKSKAHLCTSLIYRFVMEVQCPKTCNFCK
ncbi:unnamed protein product [Cylicocyclus nassatus]|uniref:ShKT domain-containing protein n=1 Tax=Cylicocyclus nassatus TaxID=53992 RepID=A0AA36GJJ1_CYLNA|nr:unnamed protein product [Cylicocyclus nassatus]